MDKYPIDKKRIRKITKDYPYCGIEHEYRHYRKHLSRQEDHFYMFGCMSSDKNGICTRSLRGYKRELTLGHNTILKAMDKLSKFGLIKYEKRENCYVIQIMQVPEYEVFKHRFPTLIKTDKRWENRGTEGDRLVTEFKRRK